MNPEVFNLSLEQQFQLQAIRNDAKHLSKSQLEDMLLEITRQLMIKDNVVKDLLKSKL